MTSSKDAGDCNPLGALVKQYHCPFTASFEIRIPQRSCKFNIQNIAKERHCDKPIFSQEHRYISITFVLPPKSAGWLCKNCGLASRSHGHRGSPFPSFLLGLPNWLHHHSVPFFYCLSTLISASSFHIFDTLPQSVGLPMAPCLSFQCFLLFFCLSACPQEVLVMASLKNQLPDLWLCRLFALHLSREIIAASE